MSIYRGQIHMVGDERVKDFKVTIFVGKQEDWRKFLRKELGKKFVKTLSCTKNTLASVVYNNGDFFNTVNLYFSDLRVNWVAHEAYHLLQRWYEVVDIKNPDEETTAMFLDVIVHGIYKVIGTDNMKIVTKD